MSLYVSALKGLGTTRYLGVESRFVALVSYPYLQPRVLSRR